MGQVTIQNDVYDVYGDEAGADDYFAAALHGAAYQDAQEHERRQALVTATRMFDRQTWQGTITDDVTPQPLQWPRKNVVDKYGNPIDENTTPTQIIEGAYELANILLSDTSIQTQPSSGSNIKEVGAGSARVVFFQPTWRTQGRFPQIVGELVNQFLAAAVQGLSAFASGTDVDSFFKDRDYGYTREGLT